MKFDMGVFFSKISVEKLSFHLNPTRITDALHNDLRTFMMVSARIILRMANVSDNRLRGRQNTHFHSIIFFPKIRAAYEIVRKHSTARQATDDNTI
jgi:hypothetical protein